MAEDLNGYFRSVFTTEDNSSLPCSSRSDYLGQLIVASELVAMKIKAMKNNQSSVVGGIPPRMLMEIAEQISTPLARVFNFLSKEGVVPF